MTMEINLKKAIFYSSFSLKVFNYKFRYLNFILLIM
uniref:Uncharacterized protein n=1 Tax=Heterorhabditis bacteriophora TaxID=37862 RepID=A0A1I7WG12_HETBA